MFSAYPTVFPVNYMGPMQQPPVQDPYTSIGLFAPRYGSNNISSSNNNYYGRKNAPQHYGNYNRGCSRGVNRRHHHAKFFEPSPPPPQNKCHRNNNYANGSGWGSWWSNENGGAFNGQSMIMNPNGIHMSQGMNDLISSYF